MLFVILGVVCAVILTAAMVIIPGAGGAVRPSVADSVLPGQVLEGASQYTKAPRVESRGPVLHSAEAWRTRKAARKR